jgi:hypothetical protein
MGDVLSPGSFWRSLVLRRSRTPLDDAKSIARFITRSAPQFSRLDRAFQRHEFLDLDPFEALNHSGLNFNGFALGRPFCRLIRLIILGGDLE